jgi:death-on-curing protein
MPTIWVERDALLFVHAKVAPGAVLNRPHLFDSALAAPENHEYYNGCNDLFELAAIYAYRLSNAQAFSDGNKRAGHAACQLFLLANGINLKLDLVESVTMLERTADNQSHLEYLAWLQQQPRLPMPMWP